MFVLPIKWKLWKTKQKKKQYYIAFFFLYKLKNTHNILVLYSTQYTSDTKGFWYLIANIKRPINLLLTKLGFQFKQTNDNIILPFTSFLGYSLESDRRDSVQVYRSQFYWLDTKNETICSFQREVNLIYSADCGNGYNKKHLRQM